MKETIEKLVEQLIGPDQNLKISEEEGYDSATVNFLIEVEDELKPKLIGKRGKAITSIYHLANIQAKKQGIRINLKVKD